MNEIVRECDEATRRLYAALPDYLRRKRRGPAPDPATRVLRFLAPPVWDADAPDDDADLAALHGQLQEHWNRR